MSLLELPDNRRTAEERLTWASAELRRLQVRTTPVRERLLECLARQTLPMTLGALGSQPGICDQFDEATIYRTLVLFEELEVVRQIRPQGRSAHFLLNAPGECFSFLICRCCGAITRVAHLAELQTLESRAAAAHGFTQVSHELELYGVCPRCQKHTEACCKPTKLMPRARPGTGGHP